jgi:hypothetical protein
MAAPNVGRGVDEFGLERPGDGRGNGEERRVRHRPAHARRGDCKIAFESDPTRKISQQIDLVVKDRNLAGSRFDATRDHPENGFTRRINDMRPLTGEATLGSDFTLGAKEAQRGWCLASAAAMSCAAQAEPPIMLAPQPRQAPAGFAPIAGRMQRASAEPASSLPSLGCWVLVTGEEKIMKGGIRLQGCIQRYILPVLGGL